MSTDSNYPILDRVEKVSKILSLVAIPFILGIGGWKFQDTLSQRNVDAEYVRLALSILTKPASEVDPKLKSWATALLNERAPVGLPAETKEQLSRGDITLPVISTDSTKLPFLLGEDLDKNDESFRIEFYSLPGSDGLLGTKDDQPIKASTQTGIYFCEPYWPVGASAKLSISSPVENGAGCGAIVSSVSGNRNYLVQARTDLKEGKFSYSSLTLQFINGISEEKTGVVSLNILFAERISSTPTQTHIAKIYDKNQNELASVPFLDGGRLEYESENTKLISTIELLTTSSFAIESISFSE